MKQLLILLSFLWPCVSYADSDNDTWRWYYSAFGSPEMSAEVLVRTGLASVKQNGGKIEINFREKNVPELAPIMVGRVSNGKVDGILRRFFMHGATYLRLRIDGAVNGVRGTFEYIKDTAGNINHRLFVPK